MGRGRASRRLSLVAGCGIAMLTGCQPSVRELATERYVTLEVAGARTIHIDRGGRLWVGVPGRMVALSPSGTETARVRTSGGEPPEVVAESEKALYLRAGDEIIVFQALADTPVASRAGFTALPVVLDPRDRFLAQGAASGAVLGFEPLTLEPLWAWPARGARTTAMAVTPEGDVVWQALEPSGPRTLLLERDLQTGRVLDEHTLFGRVLHLSPAPSGDLLVLLADDGRLHALRLRPRGDALTPIWRTALDLPGDAAPEVRYSPGAERLAVFRPENEAGLRVLDAEAGELIGSVGETPLGAAFSADGLLYVLTPTDVLRVADRR